MQYVGINLHKHYSHFGGFESKWVGCEPGQDSDRARGRAQLLFPLWRAQSKLRWKPPATFTGFMTWWSRWWKR